MFSVALTAVSITVSVSEAVNPFPVSVVVQVQVPTAIYETFPFASTVAMLAGLVAYVNGPIGGTWFPVPFSPSNSRKATAPARVSIVQLGTGELRLTVRGIE